MSAKPSLSPAVDLGETLPPSVSAGTPVAARKENKACWNCSLDPILPRR